MTKSAIVQARLEPKLKKQAETVFAALGINASTAISMFYARVTAEKGIPFDVKIPNKETRAAIREMKDPKRRAKLKRYSSAGAMFADIATDG
jgi:DNA-damage-inducible protein J